MLALTFVCAGALLSAPGTPDVGFWLRWIDLMRTHGVIGGYALAESDYLPGAFAVLAAGNWLGQALGLGVFLALKFTIALFAFAGVLIFWWSDRNPWHAVGLLIALLINSIAHAYLDALYLPSLLLMLWALQRDRPWLAGLCLGVSLCFKWQPILLAPFVFVYACAWQRAALLSIGMALPIALEIAIFGLQPITRSLGRAMSHHALSNQALNINWVLQMALHDARGLSGPLFHTPLSRPLLRVTQLCFLLAYATALVPLWRRRTQSSFAGFVWCAFMGTLAYFSLNAGVHENHLFVTMVLAFCLLTAGAPHALLACVFCALSANVNLILFYGLQGNAGAPIETATWARALSVGISLINTVFFGLCLAYTRRATRIDSPTRLE